MIADTLRTSVTLNTTLQQHLPLLPPPSYPLINSCCLSHSPTFSNLRLYLSTLTGTCKTGFYCTSSIEVVKKDGKICVTLYSDHRDHDLDFNCLVYMTLPKSEQDKIADNTKQIPRQGLLINTSSSVCIFLLFCRINIERSYLATNSIYSLHIALNDKVPTSICDKMCNILYTYFILLKYVRTY